MNQVFPLFLGKNASIHNSHSDSFSKFLKFKQKINLIERYNWQIFDQTSQTMLFSWQFQHLSTQFITLYPFDSRSNEAIYYLFNLNLYVIWQSKELQTTVEALEKERDFYFGKLREIEVICQDVETHEEVPDTLKEMCSKIMHVLYATEVRYWFIEKILIRFFLFITNNCVNSFASILISLSSFYLLRKGLRHLKKKLTGM